MGTLTDSITGPFACIGDLNCISNASEKSEGNSFDAHAARPFTNWISEAGLLDLGFTGPTFTWTNKQSLHMNIAERLDRVLGNEDWNMLFPQAKVSHLPRYNSDHSPIMLNTTPTYVHRNYPVRFERIWENNMEVKDIITHNWSTSRDHYSLDNKITDLLRNLKIWGKATFGYIPNRIKESEAELESIQALQPTAENLLREKNAVDKLNELHALAETFWHQRSRLSWIQTGDRNSRYFHLSATHKSTKNSILSLQGSDGNWFPNEHDISNILIGHFSTLFKSDAVVPIPDHIIQMLPQISGEDNESISSIPSAEEVHNILKMLGPWKSSGPDGLPAYFYQTYWDVVGKDVIDCVQEVFRNRVLPPKMNHTFLVLIPKKKDPISPGDYRPISLCNVVYKLIAKIITIRFRPFLHKLISLSQNAFVPRRHISDNIVVA